ncbi:MAG: Nif3-like dinuclear metal center hexameric protein [Oscillospiraceae bacterium]|nr:Nif3-like dinuclear metal center hexameric protein [Oscillospiraceae bacterium]
MSKLKEIVSYFEALVPPEMKMDFDNVGLLVGTNDAEVTKALVALDITDAVIDEALCVKAQLILSHHPMFFELKQVNDSTITGRKIVKMLKNGISGFCQHTNLDCVSGGVNDALADKLGVAVEGFLDGPLFTKDGLEYGMGRFGFLPSAVDFEDYLCDVKFVLNSTGLRYHNAGKPVSKVALCGGTGGNFVEAALMLGCDTLVTADVKYHQFLEAKELSLNLIDADHFCTENVVVPVLAEMLKKGFPELEVVISKFHSQTAKFY